MKQKTLLALLNAVPNLFWSVLSLTPISVFCYQFVNLSTLLTVAGGSFLAVFIPNKYLDRMQLGNTTVIYLKLGVPFINRFTQNGNIVNRLVRKRFPDHRLITKTTRSRDKLLSQTYMFERFHLMMFVFFTVISIYAFAGRHFSWFFLISIGNIIYNIYPNLLQQYIRIRLKGARKN